MTRLLGPAQIRDLASWPVDGKWAPREDLAAGQNAGVLTAPEVLARLAGDASPEVATAALVRLTALRGRQAATSQLLARLADAPAASPERARIALAWLLAS